MSPLLSRHKTRDTGRLPPRLDQIRDLAAEIPFSGPIEDPKMGLTAAGVSVLRNGFVRALLARFDPTYWQK